MSAREAVDVGSQGDDEGEARSAESLAAAARELIDRIRRTQAPADELAAATEAIRAITERLDGWSHQGPYAQAALDGGVGLIGQSHDPMEIFPYSPVIGRLNPLAPPAEFRHQNGRLVGTVTLGPAYCGPPHHVHGGVVAALMDELLGCVNVVNGLGAMTGRLTIHYRAATPLGVPLTLEASHTRSEGRKVHAEGRILDGERLLVEAEGLFIRPRDGSLFSRDAAPAR
jgi:acyl-coenzyme A thioesterase PaaI-like protein